MNQLAKIHREYRDMAKLALSLGWSVWIDGKNHMRWLPPGQTTPVTTAASPSDHRAPHKVRRDLRRAGLPLPTGSGKHVKKKDAKSP